MDRHGRGLHGNPPAVGDSGDRLLGHGSARDGMSSPTCFTVLERPVVAGN